MARKISRLTKGKLLKLARERWARKMREADEVAAARPLPNSRPASQPGRADRSISSHWWWDLERLLVSQPRSESLPRALLLFCFVHLKNRYLVKPAYVNAEDVPESLWGDRDGLADYLIESRKYPARRVPVFPLYQREVDNYEWVNAFPGSLACVSLAHRHLGNAFYSSFDVEDFWEELAAATVFVGNDDDLARVRLKVRPELIRVELEMREEEDGGIRLVPMLSFGEHRARVDSSDFSLFNENPVWLFFDGGIYKYHGSIQTLGQYRELGEHVVPAGGADRFFESFFPRLRTAYRLSGDVPEVVEVRDEAPRPRVYLMENEQKLIAQLRFSYGGAEVMAARKPPVESYVRDTEQGVISHVFRQVEQEKKWFSNLACAEYGLKHAQYYDRVGTEAFVLRARLHPFDFLKNCVPRMAAAGIEVFGEAELKLAKLNRSRPTISFNVTSGIDWFDIQAVVSYGELEVPLVEIRKALRRKERFVKLADGSLGEIPDEWLEKYKHLFGLAEVKEDSLRLGRHHVALLDQLLADQEEVRTDRNYEKARAWLKGFDGIKPHRLPKGFDGDLRPYQKAGYDWLHFLRESGFGGCLADDMGTGKTIQALCFLQSLREEYDALYRGKRGRKPKPPVHLLVVPRSLVFNWEREAARFTPGLKVLNFAHLGRSSDLEDFARHDIVLTTYGVMLREVELLRQFEFDTIILDEAQAIKNPVSESAKASRLLRGRNRLTLTGTPVENNTLELWSQFAFLNPGLLGSAEYFREGFAGPIERDSDEQATLTLRRLVYPFILRRTKEQVALDLPPRTEKILWEEMEPDQRRIYNETRDEYRARILKLIEDKGLNDARFRVLEGLLRLRQICNHPKLINPSYRGSSAKLDVLMETLETLNAEGHKALVFSQFVQMLSLVEKELNRAGLQYTYLDGSTVNRQARVDAFQQDEGIRIFLISLKAGGVGLNLTAADYVIHIDPWWNPAVEMQASDRAHRIGQEKPVFIYKLMMRDTVEEKILQLQDRKRSLVKQLITTEAGFFKSLTAEDIASLFS